MPASRTIDKVRIATVSGAHGIRGALTVRIDPSVADVLQRGVEIELVTSSECMICSVDSAMPHRRGLLVHVAEVTDRDRARALAGAGVYVDRSALPELGADEYYDFEIVGWDVVAPDGKLLGTIDDVLATGANDVYVVGRGREEILVPVTARAVLAIERDARRVVVEPAALVYPDGSESDR